jgi:general secretion pathway protein G
MAVVVLGLLAALAAPRLIGQGEEAKYARADSEVRALNNAVQLFKADNGRYPTSGEGLAVLVGPPPIDLPRYNPDGYMRDLPSRDPWGSPYTYESDGRHFVVVSYGADGSPGGQGFDADIDSRIVGSLRPTRHRAS